MKPITTISFALAFLIVSILFSLLIFQLPWEGVTNPIGHNFLFGPALAVVLFFLFDRKARPSLLAIRRFDYKPLLPVLLFLVGVYVSERVVQSFFGFVSCQPRLTSESYFGLQLPPIVWIPLFFVLLFVYTGFGEEVAWRGYLYAKLEHLSWFQKVIVINLIFALWHLPLFIFPGPYQGNVLVKLPLFIIACLELGTLLLYLRRKTNSLVPCMLLHCSATFVPNLLNRFYVMNDMDWAGFPNVFVVSLMAPVAIWYYRKGRGLHDTEEPGKGL